MLCVDGSGQLEPSFAVFESHGQPGRCFDGKLQDFGGVSRWVQNVFRIDELKTIKIRCLVCRFRICTSFASYSHSTRSTVICSFPR